MRINTYTAESVESRKEKKSFIILMIQQIIDKLKTDNS